VLIGLTGAYCAGKNTVAALLEERHWTCIDADKLGHEAMELGRDAIVGRFGTGVIGADGRLDRRELARIIFSDPAALSDQEAIVHPLAIRLMDERIAEAEAAALKEGREALVCVNAALLHRAGPLDRFDAIIEVRAPLVVRVLRGLRRDASGLPAVLRRISNQRSFRSDLYAAAVSAGTPIFVIRNLGPASGLVEKTERMLGGLRNRRLHTA
jgi:dephospho-CoA kinase